VLAILVFLSVLAWQNFRSAIKARDEQRFDEYVDNTVAKIIEQVHDCEVVLKGAAGVFAASAEVSRKEWPTYFEYQQVFTGYPGVSDVVFAPVIRSSELKQHLETIRAEDFLEYTVWPEGEREVYAPVIFVAPLNENHRAGLGFDLYADPLRRAAMEKARDTGAVTISGKMTSIVETGPDSGAGFSMIIPVFEKGAWLNTPEERQAAISGYIICFFCIEDLMAGIFSGPVKEIGFELYDGTEISAETLLYSSHATPVIDNGRRPLFSGTQTIDLYGHQWTMVSESMPAFEAAAGRHTHLAFLGAELLISFLVFLYLTGLTTTGERADRLAKEMTGELREAEQRATRQRAAIYGLVRDQIVIAGETIPALRKIVETLSDALNVERVSIWIINESGEELQCLALYEAKTGVHSCGAKLRVKAFPRYFAAISGEGRVDVEDAQQDLRTNELTEGYLKPLGITSMLDESITFAGELKGVICFEHVGDLRKWHSDEKIFVSTVATLVAQVFIFAERKQLEEQVTESRKMYKSVVDTQQEMVCRYLPDTTLTFVNDAFCRVFGRSRSELLGQKHPLLLPSADHEECIKLLTILSTTKPVVTHEASVMLPDGSTAWQEWTEQAMLDKNGKVLEIQGVGRDITGRKQAEEIARIHSRRTGVLLKVASRLNAELDLEKVHAVICEEACNALNVKMSAYQSYDGNNRRFRLTASLGVPKKLARVVAGLSREEFDILIREFGKIGVIPDLAAVPEQPYAQPLLHHNLRSFAYAVVERKGILLGIISAGDVGDKVDLPEDAVALLAGLADQAAVALDNAELFSSLERANIDLLQAYDATIKGWAHALDLKDHETEDHSRRVTEIAVGIARKMNIKDEELDHLRRGALLHDIGKMGIPDSILRKPGELTEEEWVLMRQHPVHAFNMLAAVDYLRPAMDIPYCHHEKWDGSGYPRGLKGEAIPLPARIFAVVDVYDALTIDRPYRKAWSREKALAHIKKESGSHFDPQVVELFLNVYGNVA